MPCREATQDVPIGELVGDVVDSHRIQGRDVARTAHVDTATFYRCRPVHLKRALNNRIETTPRTRAVCVTWSRLVTLGRTLRSRSKTAAPGIAPEHLGRVFEPLCPAGFRARIRSIPAGWAAGWASGWNDCPLLHSGVLHGRRRHSREPPRSGLQRAVIESAELVRCNIFATIELNLRNIK